MVFHNHRKANCITETKLSHTLIKNHHIYIFKYDILKFLILSQVQQKITGFSRTIIPINTIIIWPHILRTTSESITKAPLNCQIADGMIVSYKRPCKMTAIISIYFISCGKIKIIYSCGKISISCNIKALIIVVSSS